MDEMFTAEKGNGARLNGRKMSVSERPLGLGIAAYGTSPYYKDSLADKTFGLAKDVFLAASDIRRCGSAALDLAYLAAGRNDMFFELALYPWDIAAAQLIVKDAGGIITDKHGNELDFSRRNPVIAANKRLYPLLLEAIKEI
jgi:myo-inositol-1(or 4)-monophosphatase